MDHGYFVLVVEKFIKNLKFQAFLRFFHRLDNVNYIHNILRLRNTLKIKIIPIHISLVFLPYASILYLKREVIICIFQFSWENCAFFSYSKLADLVKLAFYSIERLKSNHLNSYCSKCTFPPRNQLTKYVITVYPYRVDIPVFSTV